MQRLGPSVQCSPATSLRHVTSGIVFRCAERVSHPCLRTVQSRAYSSRGDAQHFGDLRLRVILEGCEGDECGVGWREDEQRLANLTRCVFAVQSANSKI